jgi:hypothetical protein
VSAAEPMRDGNSAPRRRRAARVLPLTTTGEDAAASATPKATSSGADVGPSEPLLIDVDEVARLLGMHWRSVLRVADADPSFPQPLRFGARKARKGDGRIDARFTRWRLADVRAFALGQTGDAGGGGPRA